MVVNMHTIKLQYACEANSSTSVNSASVNLKTCQHLSGCWNSYIVLQFNVIHSRVYRLKILDKLADGVVMIQEWQVNETKDVSLPPADGANVLAQCLSPSIVQIATCVTLSPINNEQPKIAKVWAKVLLRQYILHSLTGTIELKQENISYGTWHFAIITNSQNVASNGLCVIIVQKSTIIQFTEQRQHLSLNPYHLIPIGSHGKHIHRVLAMSLRSQLSSTSSNSDTVFHFRSVLLQGATGSGKTTLIQQIAHKIRTSVVLVECGKLLATSNSGYFEQQLSIALQLQPSILLLENLELLFPKHLDQSGYMLLHRFMACLSIINKLQDLKFCVVATSCMTESIHDAARQLFAEEISLKTPDMNWSSQLIRKLLQKFQLSDSQVESLALRYGHTPSHTVAFCHQVKATMEREEIKIMGRDNIFDVISSNAQRRGSNFISINCATPASAKWDDIGGLHEVKQRLLEMVVWPLEKPLAFRRMGTYPPLGAILHGPPGTGKTLLARAVAYESHCHFLNVSASDLMKAEVGESEKAITRIFALARAQSPCLIFIDEFQSLFGSRSKNGITTSRMISQLLIEMDTLRILSQENLDATISPENIPLEFTHNQSKVFVLAATNCIDAIDSALTQPGRFENIIYVGYPNAQGRRAILELQRRKMHWNEKIDTEYIAQATKGYTPASLVALCRSAALHAMQRHQTDKQTPTNQLHIEHQDLTAALRQTSSM